MFCVQCGSELTDGSRFCKKCGAQQPQAASETAPSSPDSQPSFGSVPTPAPGTAGVVASLGTAKIVAIIAAITVAAVAAIFALGGGGADSAGSAPAAASASASSGASGESDAGTASDDADASATDERNASSDRIRASGFSFELPDYWKGRVICVDKGDAVAIYPDTALGAVDGYSLAWLRLVSSDEPENNGDYISHVSGRAYGDGMRVDVSSMNWPVYYAEYWYNHPNYAGSSQEQELMAALIDLSSGGRYSYDDVRSSVENASNMTDASAPFGAADYEFLNETLIPTVQVDG